MRKQLLLVGVTAAVAFGSTATVATAGNPVVAGAGSSTVTGRIALNARATEPIVESGIPGVLPPSQDLSATGFLRAPAVPVGGGVGTLDLSGDVTCIAVWLPGFAVAVSGTLDKPLVSGTTTVSNFTLLIWRFGDRPWVYLTPSRIPSPAAGTCGMQLFFIAGLDETHDLPEYHLSSGNLVINGTT